MPLDPQAQVLLDQLAALGSPPLNELDPVAARQAMAAFAGMAPPGPEVARLEERDADGVPVLVYVPGTPPPLPVLVWMHGGGWVVGSAAESDALCRIMANQFGTVVVNVDYRLAPEHPYPAPLDDCMTALRWAEAHAADYGGDAGRLAVGGDSAGGNLSAAAALRAHAEGGPALRFQLLVYPVTDGELGHPSYKENGEGYLLTADTMRWFWDDYASGEQRREPYVSPIRADDLRGLPPALVVTAEYDPLRDEGEAYGRRLEQAGVPTTVSRYDGQLHGFYAMPSFFPAAEKALAEAASAFRAATA